MTNEEAIFCLQQTNCGDCPKFYECRTVCNCSKVYEANAMAIKALEKQIPKRLTGVKMARHGDGLVVTGNCSSCGAYLYQWKNQRKFCQYCGQRIDFGRDKDD